MTCKKETLQPSTAKQTMTSREIAEISGKQHKDLLKSIRNMEIAWEKVNGRKFALVGYRDEKGEKRPMYELSKTECLYVATKFNDEARAKLVLRWEALENEKIEQHQYLKHYEKPTKIRPGLVKIYGIKPVTPEEQHDEDFIAIIKTLLSVREGERRITVKRAITQKAVNIAFEIYNYDRRKVTIELIQKGGAL